MKTFKQITALAVLVTLLISCNKPDEMTLNSPAGDIRVTMEVLDSGPLHSLCYTAEFP